MPGITSTELLPTRAGFGKALHELGISNPNVVALTADLTDSLQMTAFKKDFPERFYQVGIAESNMIGIAAGLTIGGKIPFTGTLKSGQSKLNRQKWILKIMRNLRRIRKKK